MQIKTVSLLVLSVALTACLTTQTKQTNPSVTTTPTVIKSTTLVFEEPAISAPFYPLNPLQYNAPPAFELSLQQAEKSSSGARLIIPTRQQKERAVSFKAAAGEHEYDITEIDYFLTLLEGKARHYPPQFASRKERRGFEQRLKQVIQELDTLAAQPNASFDILLRSYKATVMARNLDLGQVYITKSFNYGQRLNKLNPNDGEFALWMGFSLAEGGAQREALPYLQKAIKANVQEAYLALANAYLGMEQKKNAINTLNTYKQKYPTETTVVNRLISEIQTKNRWNVWQILP